MKKVFIKPQNTILESLTKLQETSQKCLIVVDNQNRLKGTINDGDVRRALLRKAKLNYKIEKYYKRDCYFLNNSLLKEVNIEKIFREKKINLIPILDDDNKVIDYISEKITKRNFSNHINKRYEIVIMAGGLGTRLKPYTNILPKPLLPFENKTIIENVIDTFLNYGIKKFVISLNYKNILIKSFFKELNSNYKISFLEEKKPLGTAGVLFKLRNSNKKFIVSNCDTIINLNYNNLIDFHEKTNSDLTVVVSPQINKIPYGVCKISDTQLQTITEKPEKNYLANAGLYVANNEIFRLINRNENISFVDLIKRAIKKNKKISVYPITSNVWIDLGQSIKFTR